jgi:hypothetical protein
MKKLHQAEIHDVISKKSSSVRQSDVHEINNPAYVVKAVNEGGCIVEWNQQFEQLTGFRPEELDVKYCYQLIDAFEEFQDEGTNYVVELGTEQLPDNADKKFTNRRFCKAVCKKKCRYRPNDISKLLPTEVVRDIWIRAKDDGHKDIRKLVDIYVFPFKDDSNHAYALHVIFDRGQSHSEKYFWDRLYFPVSDNKGTIDTTGHKEKLDLVAEQEKLLAISPSNVPYEDKT